MKTLRAVVAGAGLMGWWHADGVRRSGGEVAAVVDRDISAARRLARRCKTGRATEDLLNALSNDQIDVLHICTPAETHFEIASAALARGVHVLIEKPMTPTAAESERLYELANEKQLLICPVHQFLFQNGVVKARAALPSIGRLLHFDAVFCSAGADRKNAPAPDAVISEILPHPLSLMQLFVPGSLNNRSWQTTRPATGEFRGVLTIEDVCFSILISMKSRPTASVVRLLGSNGTIHLDLFHGFCVVEPGAVSRWRKIAHPFDLSARTLFTAGQNLAARAASAEPAYPGLRALIASFYAAINEKAPLPISRADALAVARARELLSAA